MSQSPPLVIISANVMKGTHLSQITTWLDEQRPDLLFLQEVMPGHLSRYCDALGMDGYVAAPLPDSSNNNAILLRRRGPFALLEEHPQEWAPWHAPANVTVRLRGRDGSLSRRNISCVSMHACYWSATNRLLEAQWCSTLTKPGWLALVMGDWNSYRADEEISWEGYADTAFVANRTYVDGGARVTDDRPDREMLAAGYVELGRHAAEQLGQADAMKATAGWLDYPGRLAGMYCIDRGYISPELVPAVTSFEVCDTPLLRTLSDHLPQKVSLDPIVLDRILNRASALFRPDQDQA